MESKSMRMASILGVIIALFLVIRVSCVKTSFDKTVREARLSSEGYDEQLIRLVNKLEQDLAQRARFGYPGGKDPMTGKMRQVVSAPRAAVRAGGTHTEKPRAEESLKLTAIIFDNNSQQFAAVMMDGERSFSAEVGEMIRDRKIVKITDQGIVMENATQLFYYDIHGNQMQKPK